MQKDKDSQKWQFPSLDLLDEPLIENENLQNTEKNSKVIINVLKSHDIEVSINPDEIKVGPTFTQYPLDVKSTILISKIIKLEKEITLAVDSVSGTIRMVGSSDQIPNLYIEIPNEKRQKVYFKTATSVFNNREKDFGLIFPLGMGADSKIYSQDIKYLPHLLIGGSTGSGKISLIHNIILSMLFTKTPEEMKLIIIDTTMVNFSEFRGTPHLLRPIVIDFDEGVKVLEWAVEEMERRNEILIKERVRNIKEYNEKVNKIELPEILIVLPHDLGDLIIRDPVSVEKSIIRLAMMGKYSKIHLVLSTQRPSVEIFTGLIRANIVSRAGFQVLNKIESRILIDQEDAEKLLGRGDMLFLSPDNPVKPLRVQVPYISYEETERVVDFVKKQSKFLS